MDVLTLRREPLRTPLYRSLLPVLFVLLLLLVLALRFNLEALKLARTVSQPPPFPFLAAPPRAPRAHGHHLGTHFGARATLT
jgi:hypothetical protein